jgi:hypothetical protein
MTGPQLIVPATPLFCLPIGLGVTRQRVGVFSALLAERAAAAKATTM